MDRSYEYPASFGCMFQGPSLWSEPAPPTSMANCHGDGSCSLIPTALSTLQALSELELDNSLNKIFEDLPEIFEDGLCRDESDNIPVVVSSSFPSTPPRPHAGKPSAMSLSIPVSAIPLREELLAEVFASSVSKALPFTARVQQLSSAVAVDCKEARPRKIRKGRGTISASLPEARVPSVKFHSLNALEAIPICEALTVQASADCVLPKALPSNVTVQRDLGSVIAVIHGQPRGLHPQRRVTRESVCTKRTQMTGQFDKAEHIFRERWRRDDMAGKFMTLESLLPPGSKRDRSTIVDEAMNLVKSLQHRKEKILKRRSEMRLAVASAGRSPRVKPMKPFQQFGSLTINPFQGNAETVSPLSSSMDLPSLIDPAGHMRRTREGTQPFELTESMTVSRELRDIVESFQVKSEPLHENMVIEMICQPVPNFQSTLFAALEGTFSLEVTCCSVTKTFHKLFCNITVKPYPRPAHLRQASTSIVEALKSAFGTQETSNRVEP